MLWINSYVNKEAILPIHEIRVTPTDGGPLGQDVQAIGRVTEEPVFILRIEVLFKTKSGLASVILGK